MSGPKFTTEEMVDGIRRALGSVRRENRGDTDVSCILRAIAGRLSDPWSAFAGWQPPKEADRADGFKCMGFVTGLVDVDDEFVESAAEPEWMIISWQIMSGLTKFWTCVDGIERRPTAFAPLPPKES